MNFFYRIVNRKIIKFFLVSLRKKITNSKLKIFVNKATQATFAKVAILKLEPAINPPKRGPIVNPKPKATPNNPIPFARSFFEVMSAIYAVPTDTLFLKRPAIILDKNIIVKLPLIAKIKFEEISAMQFKIIKGFLPNLSDKLPQIVDVKN